MTRPTHQVMPGIRAGAIFPSQHDKAPQVEHRRRMSDEICRMSDEICKMSDESNQMSDESNQKGDVGKL